MLNTDIDLLRVFKNKNIYVITDHDLDGVSSHLMARYFLKPIVKEFNYDITGDRAFVDIQHDLINKGELDYIIFVDTAPSKELYETLNNSVIGGIFIFDHHISSKIELGEIENYFFDLDRCGARIFFEEVTRFTRVPRIVKQYIELVDTYDRWQQDSLLWKHAKNLQNVMFGTVNWFDKKLDGNTRFIPYINRMLDKFQYAKVFYLTPTEQSLADDGDRKERNALDTARKTMRVRQDNDRNGYIWFECHSKLSFVANCLLNEYKDKIQYCIGYSTFDQKQKSISLRSIDNFDCSAIAERHGGGGHKNASGVDLTNNPDFFNDLKQGVKHLV